MPVRHIAEQLAEPADRLVDRIEIQGLNRQRTGFRPSLLLAISFEDVIERDLVDIPANQIDGFGGTAREDLAAKLGPGEEFVAGIAHRFQAAQLKGQSRRHFGSARFFAVFSLRQ